MDIVVVARIAFCVVMMFAGVMHFVVPRGYLRMVPPWLPAPKAIVVVSGVAEIALGAAMLVPALSPWAAYAMIALLVAVFPANIHMALHKISPTKKPLAPWLLWARLPFQFVFIAWAWWVR